MRQKPPKSATSGHSGLLAELPCDYMPECPEFAIFAVFTS